MASWSTLLCATDSTGSVRYHRREKPCQTACDLPLLNENKMARTIGTSDQTRYSQVKPYRNHGRRHGLRLGQRGPGLVAALAASAARACWVVAAVVMTPPSPSGPFRAHSRPSG